MSRRGPFDAFWPTETQEALLRLVLGRDDRVEDRWRALQPLDLDHLDLGSFCLLPLLHTRLSDAGLVDPLAGRIAGIYRSTWYRNQLANRCLGDALVELDGLDIGPTVFGGASMATRFYAQPAHRPLPQLDLLVHPDEAGEARYALLRANGWSLLQDCPSHIRLESRERTVLVLHRGLQRYLAGPLTSGEALGRLLPRRTSAALGRGEAPVLAAADEVVAACGLGARTKAPPSLQWLLDTAAVLSSGACSAVELAAAAADLKLTIPVRRSVEYIDRVAERFGLDAAFLLAQARPSRHERAAYLLGGVDRPFAAGGQRLASFIRSTSDASLAQTVRIASAGIGGAVRERRSTGDAEAATWRGRT
jgi:hypothetical protein